jgi:hypothetical protein
MAEHWVKLTNVASAIEAGMLVEQLKANGLFAMSVDKFVTGMLGPGFQGATALGVDVMVASSQLEEAREIVADMEAGYEAGDQSGVEAEE